jgi:hypothetical protein
MVAARVLGTVRLAAPADPRNDVLLPAAPASPEHADPRCSSGQLSGDGQAELVPGLTSSGLAQTRSGRFGLTTLRHRRSLAATGNPGTSTP